MNKGDYLAGSLLVVLAAAIAGCSGGNSAGDGDSPVKEESKPKNEPVTIVAARTTYALGDALEALIKDKLSVKYPHITFELLKDPLEQVILTGTTPDIVFTYNGYLSNLQKYDVLYDISPLIASQKFDLDKFDPGYIRDSKVASKNNEMYGIPFNVNFHALYYNKNLFDKFGAPYPKDGMTWDETYELAKKVTRFENGVQYRGLDLGNIVWVGQPFRLTYVDANTEKAIVTSEQWKRVFEMGRKFSNLVEGPFKASQNTFLKDQTDAMLLFVNLFDQLGKAPGLDWDVAQYPSYPDLPNVYGNASVNLIMITKSSKHKEQALQVIETITADDFQLERSKQGYMTPLKSTQIKQALGEGVDHLKGKNLTGIYKSRPVEYPVLSEYERAAQTIALKHFNEYVQGKIDVVTAQRRADEEINKMIAAEKQK